jgi:hypothetical protein
MPIIGRDRLAPAGRIGSSHFLRQWNGPAVLLPRQQAKLARGAKDKEHLKSVVDGSRLDQLRFRFLPEEWRAFREKAQGK